MGLELHRAARPHFLRYGAVQSVTSPCFAEVPRTCRYDAVDKKNGLITPSDGMPAQTVLPETISSYSIA